MPNPHCSTLVPAIQHTQANTQYRQPSTQHPIPNTQLQQLLDSNLGLFTFSHHDHNCHLFSSSVVMINDLRPRIRAFLIMCYPILRDLGNKRHVLVLDNELRLVNLCWWKLHGIGVETCRWYRTNWDIKRMKSLEAWARSRIVHLILSRQCPGDEYIRMYLHRRVLFSNSKSGRMFLRALFAKILVSSCNRLIHLQLGG